MENAAQKMSEIDEQLAEDAEELTIIRENLDKSAQLTQNMVGILTSFENRLLQLEETILPVHNETVSLQKLQQNIENTLLAFDNVLQYHEAVRTLEPAIKNGPGDDLEQYVSFLDQIEEARAFFDKNNPSSPELAKANNLFEEGKKKLVSEFQSQLSRNSHPVTPIQLLDVLDPNDSGSLSEMLDDQDQPNLEQLPEKVIEELAEIARWLKERGKEEAFVKIYFTNRATVTKESIEQLKDYLSKKSGGSLTAPLPARGTKINTSQRKLRGKKGAVVGKPGFETGHKRQGAHIAEMREEQLDPESECFLNCLTGLLRLMQSERQLMNAIIMESDHFLVFDKIVEKPLDIVVQMGEVIVNSSKRSVHKHDYTAVLGILPVLKFLLAVTPDFDKTLQGATSALTRGKLPSIVTGLETTGAKALEEFFDFVKNDPDKANMPKDGTVHELTSNSLIFLESIYEFVDTVAAMLSVQRERQIHMKRAKFATFPLVASPGLDGVSYASVHTGLDLSAVGGIPDPTANKKKVATYVGEVLGGLSLNLLQKAKTYSDPYLGDVFLLNNNNYILKSLQRSGLIDLVVFFNPDIESNYEEMISEQKKKYAKSWTKLLNHVLEGYHPGAPRAPVPQQLKDRERQNIKDKFKGFNQDLEEIYKTQKCYAIPDPKLRENLRRRNREFIVPSYRKFRERYIATSFTKNPEKYIKYTPEQVEQMLDKFFDITA